MYCQKRISLWLGSIVALIGIAVLWGWAVDWPALKSVWPTFPAMMVNTALGFVFCGFALGVSTDGDGRPARGWRQRTATVCAALAMLVGGGTLGQHLAGWDFHIDHALIADTSGAGANTIGGRMTPVTALCFAVIGGALILLPRESRFWSWAVQSLAAVVGLVALLPALGYLFDAVELRRFLGTDVVALPTMGAFVALALGILVFTARRGWVQVITSSTFGSIAGRYLLPAVFVAPLALGFFHYVGENSDWFSAELGFILSMVLNTVLFFALTLWAISALNRVDRVRQSSQEALRELAQNLQERVEQRTAEIEEINRQLRCEIDVRLAAEAALIRNEESYRTITRSLPQLVWTSSPDGSIDWHGPQLVAYAGVPTDEDLGDRWTQVLHPDDRGRVVTAWKEACATGANFEIDFRIRRADGAHRWFKSRAVPHRDVSGSIVKWFGTCTDVEDLRRAETTVRENEGRFSLMVEASLNSIVMVDPNGIIRHANPQTAQLLGYAPGELDGKSIELLISLAARLAHAQQREGFHRAPTPRGMADGRELMAQRKDGSKVPVEVILQPLETLEGPQVMATIFDVSERVRVREAMENMNHELELRVAVRTAELAEANTRAQEANRLKSEFLANMSHELRTPLNAIIGFTVVLEFEKPGPLNEGQKDCVKEVQVAGRHLLRLINDLLDLAKIEAGRLEPSVQSFALSPVVDEVVASLVPLATAKQISLTAEVSLEDDEVILDQKMTKQILYNLLSNALKFTPDRGAVSLSARAAAEGFVTVRVSDTGIGIQPDDFGRLFQRFGRLEAAGTRHVPGSGLGLAISKTLTELQGGSIRVESIVGRGTTFTVLLPRQAIVSTQTALLLTP